MRAGRGPTARRLQRPARRETRARTRRRGGGARGGASTCAHRRRRAQRGAGPRPKPCPSAARPRRAWKPEAGEEEPVLSFSEEGEGQGPCPAEPQPRAARALRQRGTMGTPRRGPPVLPGPPLGRLLVPLLLSGLSLARASPRLLDYPAPVCSQAVRPRRALRMLRGRVKCPRRGNARGFSEGPRVGHEERPRSRELLERWELRGGRESRGSFRGKDPTQRPGQEAGGPPPGPPRFGEGEGGVGPGRRGGQSGLEREVGRALRGSQDWPGAASSLCTLRIPVVQGRATARAPDTHPDLESFPSKESGQLRHSD